MGDEQRLRYLRGALLLFGLAFVLGLYPLMLLWSSAWTWEPRQPEYEQMLLGVYATLGIFLILASRNPLDHLSLIWFTVWSSFVHGGFMAVQAFVDPLERANLIGDVPTLFTVAIVPAWLTPRRGASS